MYYHGSRSFAYGSNALSAFTSYEKLETLLKANQQSVNAAQLLDMMKNPSLYKQLAVMARLSVFVKDIWRNITIKQPKKDLISNITEIKYQIRMLNADIFNLDEIADSIQKSGTVDQEADNKCKTEFANDEDFQIRETQSTARERHSDQKEHMRTNALRRQTKV